MKKMDYNSLAKIAIKAKKNALPIYSRFFVGAALLTKGEKVYTGVNVESSSYGLTMCAERTAVFKAISEGERKFKAIAVASDMKDFCPPCGACRQVLWDLCGDIDIIMVNHIKEIQVKKMSEVLPFAFDNEKLKNV
jgi:cytidine deaminase